MQFQSKVLIALPHLRFSPGEERIRRALYRRVEIGAAVVIGDFGIVAGNFTRSTRVKVRGHVHKKFYGLTRNPFEVSPDPYFFLSRRHVHTEALTPFMSYGVLRRKGFVVLTGEVGTGKTLLVRCLLEALTKHKVAFAYMYNPILSVPEFLGPCN